MTELILFLGLLGFMAGILGVTALLAQRDANRERERAAERKGEVRQ